MASSFDTPRSAWLFPSDDSHESGNNGNEPHYIVVHHIHRPSSATEHTYYISCPFPASDLAAPLGSNGGSRASLDETRANELVYHELISLLPSIEDGAAMDSRIAGRFSAVDNEYSEDEDYPEMEFQDDPFPGMSQQITGSFASLRNRYQAILGNRDFNNWTLEDTGSTISVGDVICRVLVNRCIQPPETDDCSDDGFEDYQEVLLPDNSERTRQRAHSFEYDDEDERYADMNFGLGSLGDYVEPEYGEAEEAREFIQQQLARLSAAFGYV